MPEHRKLTFPDFTLVSASAGSGKTYTLTQRYIRFLLSEDIPDNALHNILAITFTNNAAREMKHRIVGKLKDASLGHGGTLDALCSLLEMGREEVQRRSSEMVDYILDHYSEFQVQTIDSFLSRIFRTSALDFGFSPSVETRIDSSPLLQESFDRFTQELALDPSRRSTLDGLMELLLASQPADARYLWNPFSTLCGEVRGLYNTLIQRKGELAPPPQLLRRKQELQHDILRTYRELHKLILQSKGEIVKNFETLHDLVQRNDIESLIARKSLYNPPVKKTGLTKEAYERLVQQCEPLQKSLKAMADEYVVIGAQTYYNAYAEALRYFRGVIKTVMKETDRVTIGDVNQLLATMITKDIVPEIFFFLGENLRHYLMDEFQDTAPLQWDVFRPLLEETLSKEGSLFVVGDTKQSIYTFRGADWQIMRRLMERKERFDSAPVHIENLGTNFRSRERILEFNREVFHKIVPSVVPGDASRLSGLSDYSQAVKPEFKGKGYVEVFPIEEDPDGTVRQTKLLEILSDCRARGYSYNEITVLTPKNSDVVAISGWLNRESIPFIAHSNLDIRGRTVTGELIAVLRFLDSPVDDLSLLTFLLGGIFQSRVRRDPAPVLPDDLHKFVFSARRGANRRGTLYRAFREYFPQLWTTYFEGLYNRVGYLPLYDLVSELYKAFDLFALLPDEEACLVKFLEVIKDFEKDGQNSLKDFLTFAEEASEDSDWNIPVPQKTDAVSVMTIHKAKGLDNRVVIVLLQDTLPRHDSLFIREDDRGLHLLRITKDSADADPDLRRLYMERQVRNAVDDLNKLYVAFTRAKEELYIISIKAKRADQPSKFLPHTGYEPGPKPKVKPELTPPERIIGVAHVPDVAAVQQVAAESISLYERKRGEYIHAVLAKLEFAADDSADQVRQAVRDVEHEYREQLQNSALEKLLVGFLENPGVRVFFFPKEGRSVSNEQEFAQPDGRLFRMDRIIVDADAVNVIDYKTGNEDPAYTTQVQGYMNILGDIYSGLPVRGFLAYVDRGVVREVEAEQR